MATESFGVFQSFKAAADYSAKQYFLMYVSAADTVTICGTRGTVCGILYNKPILGAAAQVLTACGVLAKVSASGAVNVGQLVESDTNGQAVAFTFDGAGTTETYMVGRAVTASTATGQIITVLTNFCPASL